LQPATDLQYLSNADSIQKIGSLQRCGWRIRTDQPFENFFHTLLGFASPSDEKVDRAPSSYLVTSKFTPYLKEEQTRFATPPQKNSSTKSEVLLQSINQSVEKRTKQVCVKPLTTKVLQSFKESLLELFLWGLGSLKCVCSEFGVFLHLSEKRTGVCTL